MLASPRVRRKEKKKNLHVFETPQKNLQESLEIFINFSHSQMIKNTCLILRKSPKCKIPTVMIQQD